MKLTHVNERGEARMVDVGEKSGTKREARAQAIVTMKEETLALLQTGAPKGDVIAAARIAGIMAAKKTSELIPLCHPLPLDHAELSFETIGTTQIRIMSTVRCTYHTGAEMEALTAASIAALTIYDMLKAVDRGMRVDGVCLLYKSGGKSGTYRRE